MMFTQTTKNPMMILKKPSAVRYRASCSGIFLSKRCQCPTFKVTCLNKNISHNFTL